MRAAGECHAHLMMDGINYRNAVQLHRNGVQDWIIREHFQAYQERGITFVRDGGDALGVSRRAAQLAAEYGIDYRTPVFAIHRKGTYGSIVGFAFEDQKDFCSLVRRARAEHADFIKIMTSGILDFSADGDVTGRMLPPALVKEMVHIAHEEGMAVMCHVNGEYAVQAALEAGIDSLEHGNFMSEANLRWMADSGTIWVPTLVTIRNLIGSGRYDDALLRRLYTAAAENLKTAFRLGVKTACGSDAGAFRVSHGEGILQEQEAFLEILGDSEQVRSWISSGEEEIRKRFQVQ